MARLLRLRSAGGYFPLFCCRDVGVRSPARVFPCASATNSIIERNYVVLRTIIINGTKLELQIEIKSGVFAEREMRGAAALRRTTFAL